MQKFLFFLGDCRELVRFAVVEALCCCWQRPVSIGAIFTVVGGFNFLTPKGVENSRWGEERQTAVISKCTENRKWLHNSSIEITQFVTQHLKLLALLNDFPCGCLRLLRYNAGNLSQPGQHRLCLANTQKYESDNFANIYDWIILLTILSLIIKRKDRLSNEIIKEGMIKEGGLSHPPYLIASQSGHSIAITPFVIDCSLAGYLGYFLFWQVGKE